MSDGMHALNDSLIRQKIKTVIDRLNKGEELTENEQKIIEQVREHQPHLLQDSSSLSMPY